MKSRNLNGSLAIVAVGVVLGIIAFAVESLRFLLVLALLITVLGGGIAFFRSMEES